MSKFKYRCIILKRPYVLDYPKSNCQAKNPKRSHESTKSHERYISGRFFLTAYMITFGRSNQCWTSVRSLDDEPEVYAKVSPEEGGNMVEEAAENKGNLIRET